MKTERNITPEHRYIRSVLECKLVAELPSSQRNELPIRGKSKCTIGVFKMNDATNEQMPYMGLPHIFLGT